MLLKSLSNSFLFNFADTVYFHLHLVSSECNIYLGCLFLPLLKANKELRNESKSFSFFSYCPILEIKDCKPATLKRGLLQ